MGLLRKIALGLLMGVSTAVLVMAGWELWNYRQSAFLPRDTGASLEGRARALQDRIDLLTKRVGDMELLTLILLGTSGIYAIVFVASSYFSATSFARQADHTIGHIQDQIGLAMGDLRELQEETEQRLRQISSEAAPVQAVPEQQAAGWQSQVNELSARLAFWQDRPLSEHARLELVQDENVAAYLEVTAGAKAGSAMCSDLAALYLAFGRIYASSDSARSRFYLERALRLATPDSPLTSEIHYQLAGYFAGMHDFERALRELASAFEHQFKTLDQRLAGDIEEGGKLYELASTPPYDRAVNDLLLNMSIGIG
jgi:hypothetical protein